MSEWLDTLARNAAGSIPVVDRVFGAAGTEEAGGCRDRLRVRAGVHRGAVGGLAGAGAGGCRPPTEVIVTEHGSGRRSATGPR